MGVETAPSPYLHPRHPGLTSIDESWTEMPAGLAYFAFGKEVIGRQSSTCGYLVSALEINLEAPDLVVHAGTAAPQPIDIQIGDRGIIVNFVGPEETVARALDQVLKWSFSNILDLVTAVHRSTPELVSTEEPPVTMGDLAADATVEEMAQRITELTSLSDGQLARMFPGEVHRETYQRWRTGQQRNPTPANRRRMGLLLRLVESLDKAGLAIDEWVRNPSSIDDLSPYDLLVQGRLDEVERLGALVAPAPEQVEVVTAEGQSIIEERGIPAFTPREDESKEDLEFEDEGDWVEIEDDVDDEES